MTVLESPSDGYRQGPWNLGELLPTAEADVLAERLGEIRVAVEALEARRADLSPDIAPEAFLDLVLDYEALIEKMLILASYGSLWFSADTQSEAALTFKNRVEQELTEYQNRVLFLNLWWKDLSDEEADRLLPRSYEHADQRHLLQDARRLKPFTLDEASEQIINLKDSNGIGAVLTLYSMLTNRLEFRLEVDGEEKTLTRDELMSHAFSPDPELRAGVYRELLDVFGRDARILGQIYVNRVRDWHNENVKVRGFASPISVRNIHNDIPDAAIDTLLEVSRDNVALFQRYFGLKAKWLGMEKLRRYDIYAPLAPSHREIPYADAVDLVLDTFASFHPTLRAHAERVFAEGHIDSEIRPGKKGGAFCLTVSPRHTPWVLVNYTGRPRDVATLAHELGHAIHSMLAEEHSVTTQHSVLPLAETASVFSEMLLTDRLLSQESDPDARRELLASAVDDAYATVIRQAYFVHFERLAHEAIIAGKAPNELEETYLGTLEEQFGDTVEIPDRFRQEWLAIPHIYHTPFYCYAYSFGQLLVLALYRRFQEEGEAFKPGYLRLLAHGGSARPVAILEEAGVDVTDPEFWQGGFEVVKGLIRQLEELGE